MDYQLISTVILPIALGIIMLGLGLSLTTDDFKRVVVFPKAVLIGLFCQMVLLPGVCYSVAMFFRLPPELAVGLMLLAASPGGATANLYSHLSKGDVVLNITLTAVNSILSLFTLPFIVNFAMEAFMGEGRYIPLQFAKVVQIFVIVLGPVSIGMFIRSQAPQLAERFEKPVKIFSVLFLAFIIVVTFLSQQKEFHTYFQVVGLAALTFNLLSMVTGYFVPLLFKIAKPQAIAIGMEIGIHNGTLAIAIATSPLLLNNQTMSMPAVIYSLIMFVTAAVFGYLVNLKSNPS
ncbi:MAG TPA: bile acid:sodium symporter [Microscillaceae bacterium]|jgi:BASS family bile acid:Na+ symporter|nr:bile acid:sodium symporter [Microscillaceae bacterium]